MHNRYPPPLATMLQQKRAQSRLLFYDKESVEFPTHCFIFVKETIGRWLDSFSSVFYTLIRCLFSTNRSARYI